MVMDILSPFGVELSRLKIELNANLLDPMKFDDDVLPTRMQPSVLIAVLPQ